MKYQKTLFALAAWMLSAAAQAQSGVTIYGRIDLTVTKQNSGTSALTASNGRTGPAGNRWDVRHGSENRLGFRGVEELGNGLKAGFQMEHRFLGDTGVADPVFWKARSFVYLQSNDLGTVYLGREYIPAFWPAFRLDPWGWDTVGTPSLNHHLAGYRVDGHARANNSVGYKSVSFGGLTTNIAVSAGEGVRPRTEGANFEYMAGPLYIGGAIDRQGSRDRVALVGASYDFKVIKPSFMYTKAKAAGKKASNIMVAASIPVGTDLVRVAVARLDPEGDDNNITKFGAGYEHFFSKRTSVYGDVGTAKQQGVLAGQRLTRSTVFDFGLKHNF